MKKRNLLLHLLLPVIVLMVLVNFNGQGNLLKSIFKPLIMVWIAAYFVVNLTVRYHPVVVPTLLAFLFSWIGDIALLFSGSIFFLSGLSSFLVSHLFYIMVFHRIEGNLSGSLLWKNPVWILPLVLYGGIILGVILPLVGFSMKVAVLLYTGTILTMAATALNRKGRVPGRSFVLVLVGALLFVTSDSLIAFNRFVDKIPWSGFLVMSTYMTAQLLIMCGLLLQVNQKKNGGKQLQPN